MNPRVVNRSKIQDRAVAKWAPNVGGGFTRELGYENNEQERRNG